MDSLSREDQHAQVLVVGDINCSLEEAIDVLSVTNERELNATMKGLYRKEFIYGSIVHVTSSKESTPAETPHGRQGKFSNNLVAVKTGTFVRSKPFSRNEEWCFVEANERSPCGDAFRLTQSTLDAAEIGIGRVAAHSRVDQLRDLTTAFLIEKQPNNRSVRLFFHGKFDCRQRTTANVMRQRHSGIVSRKASKARLLVLAKGVSRIPNIIRRRRVGIQTLAATSVFAKRTNSHCTCCTTRLHLLTRKKPCYLCGYHVCNKCWSRESMETNDGEIMPILLCSRCHECVNSCEYSEISSSKSRRMAQIESDAVDTNPSSKKALVDLLETALDDSDEAIQAAAKVLITYILKQCSPTHHHKQQQRNESQEATPESNNGDDGGSNGSLENARVSDPEDSMHALETLFKLEPQPSLEDCVLANIDARNYRIHMPENPSTTAANYPVNDESEARRLNAIEESRFSDLDELAELNLICSLAAKEMNCAIGQLTVIEQDTAFILACTMKELHRTRMPRNQTFCSHLIMDDKPFLLLHPEADVRFFNYDAVTKSGIRFYCGFPITAKTGEVVGSLCCLDFQQRMLTRSQYATMKKLAAAASRVIQTRSIEMLSKSCKAS
uniref:FYVE-type domain-containing protein n=1 Tax=Globisporangium ultimum (strain ATCC 200006 / CBS 805.95 / DAOM BR144) TaxID=431595 RepID=K3WQW9_GLOUD